MKNILILGSARSGTHALGSHLSNQLCTRNLGEICIIDEVTDPRVDIQRIMDLSVPSVAHLVQMSSKVKISDMVGEIKQKCEIICLRRRNKVQQFASWIYFHRTGGVFRSWHNHQHDEMRLEKNSITVSEQDVDQFLLEQMLDAFFMPDRTIYYEDCDFALSDVKKNLYAWDLSLIFSNLDYVRSRLGNYYYHDSK